jgi:hypothetical protein
MLQMKSPAIQSRIAGNPNGVAGSRGTSASIRPSLDPIKEEHAGRAKTARVNGDHYSNGSESSSNRARKNSF